MDNDQTSARSGGSNSWHYLSRETIASRFQTDLQNGLTSIDASERLVKHGPNRLLEAAPLPIWKKLAAQFKDLVIWILIAAALISGLMGEWVDAIAILSIVILNGFIGYFQEERAERALSALQKLSAPSAKTIRNGMMTTIPSNDLVIGDLIEVEAGDNVPADARLVTAFSVTVQEASLTGESTPVEKGCETLPSPDVPLGDRRNCVFMGTVVATGKARGIVVATAMDTELGRIAGLLQRYAPEVTPLQRKLAELGRILLVICLVIVAVIFSLQLLRGGSLFDSFLLSVTLAVAAVPEGLPAVVTIALALGVQRMVKRNALVRKLPSVETLGSVTVICTDKTGTLTRNEMTVREIITANSRYSVSGVGYDPHGEFRSIAIHQDRPDSESGNLDQGEVVNPVDGEPELQKILRVAAFCNNARLVPKGDGDNAWQVIGDPTEGALIVAARKASISETLESNNVLYEIPFDSTRKSMAVAVRKGSDAELLIKGAPEVILERSISEFQTVGPIQLSSKRRKHWLDLNSQMASRAMRVLALAYRDTEVNSAMADADTDLVFIGLIGMIDSPREEARQAVSLCGVAGIRPVMITGDHPETAMAIARELGMVATGDRAISGTELETWTDEQLTDEVETIPVYARATAEHKLRIINAWQKRHHVVAMTGDGVNDAPAIKAADIGIAMGITGTDVTKEAADMILTDDNFASIVSAIEEGRSIYDNIQKVLQYLLACNFGEILLMLISSLLGWPVPLLPIHLLWINLVTDGLPALALSFEPPEPEVMRRPPRNSKESILSWSIGFNIAFQGMLVGIVGLTAFCIGSVMYPGDIERARAITFGAVVYDELFRSFASRSRRLNFFQVGPFRNPMLLLAVGISGMLQLSVTSMPFTQHVLNLHPHSLNDWFVIFGLALVPVTILELLKFLPVQSLIRPLARYSGRGSV